MSIISSINELPSEALDWHFTWPRHFLQEHTQNISRTKIIFPVRLCLLCLYQNTIVCFTLLFSSVAPLELPSVDSHSQMVASSSKFYFPNIFPPFSPLSPLYLRVLTPTPIYLISKLTPCASVFFTNNISPKKVF